MDAPENGHAGDVAGAANPSLPFPEIYGFRIERRLVSSPKGDVYQAMDLRNGERVVLKTGPISQSPSDGIDSGEVRGRLEREASILANLDHPCITKLINLWEENEACFLVLGHIEGRPLSDILTKGKRRLTEKELRSLLVALTDTVAYLHGKEILHRDLKPDNIVVDSHGQPTIVDFGSARDMRHGSQQSPNYVTDGYSAPELYENAENEGRWSDIYSLGAIAFHAVTGKIPAPAPNGANDSLTAGASAQFYSRTLLETIESCLSASPQNRPSSAEALRSLLEKSGPSDKLADGSGVAGDAETLETPYPPTRPVQRRAAPLPPPMAAGKGSHREKPSRSGRGFLTALLLLAAIGAVGAWQGWPLYQRHYKMTWVVDASGKGDTTSAGEALRLAPEGATVLIRPGLYAESLVMERSLIVVGETVGDLVPTLAPLEGSCATITASEGTLSNLRFEPQSVASDGIGACLDVQAGSVVVAGNVIQSPGGTGIVVRKGATPRLIENQIAESGGSGILFAGGAGGEVTRNHISQSAQSGILVRGGSAATFLENRIEQSGGSGIVVAEGARGHFEGNEVIGSAGSGIEVLAGAAPTFQTNVIAESGEAGLFIYDAGGGTFTENQISRNTIAGVVIDGGGTVMRANVIEGNGEHGMIILSGEATVADNLVRDNAGHGIVATKGVRLELGTNELKGNKKDPQLLQSAEGKRK